MKIAIGADHGGFGLKEELVSYLHTLGHELIDVGTSSIEATDYPVFAYGVAKRVAEGTSDCGIVIDGAGIGSSMTANKVRGIRAALAYDVPSARNSREHNDANILTLGARFLDLRRAKEIVDTWLATSCTEERHRRRVALIERIEGGEDLSLPASPTLIRPAGTPERSQVQLVPQATCPPELTEADLDRIARQLEVLLGASGGPHRGRDDTRQGPTVASSPETARRFLELGARRLSTGPGPGAIPEDIASYIDHTLLRPEATESQIRALCEEAKEHRFAAVCVNPYWIPLVSKQLRGSGVTACAVTGFPLGANQPETKAFEARRAIREGAREIDMVINIGALKGGDEHHVLKDIRAVVEACRDGSSRCKVILETALLTDEEKRRACRLAMRARADFVKTSTGFGPGGATVEDVSLMATEVHVAGLEVKASGGIRTFDDARSMIDAGATRIGASAGVRIVQEAHGITAAA